MSTFEQKPFEEIYTLDYCAAQIKKHKERHNNHWKNHIWWAKKLVNDYGKKPPVTLLDLGCSIGTHAIEFALEGYETIGLDLDPKALKAANELARQEGCNPKWICADAGKFTLDGPVDVILCFDLLEHLDDESIRGLLGCVKQNLKPGGVFVYHTFPTEFDHVFYKNHFFNRLIPNISLPLIPFGKLGDDSFANVVRGYSRFLDLFSLVMRGKTHRQIIKGTVHPNPLSQERLDVFFKDAGFEVVFSRAGIADFNPLKPRQGEVAVKHFSTKTVAQRSLWGVARV